MVEGILNYGDMNDVRELIALLGMQEVAKIFRVNIWSLVWTFKRVVL